MALSIVSRNYSTRAHTSGNNFLLANSGQLIREEVEIVLDFDFISDVNVQALVMAENKIQVLSGTWGERGFAVGNVVTLAGGIYIWDGTTTTTIVLNPATTYTIVDLIGNVMTLSANFVPTSAVAQLMPSNYNTAIKVLNTSVSEPASLDFYHNLIPNAASAGDYSLLDDEVNRFKAENVAAMSVGDTVSFEFMGNRSGGSYIEASLERLADVSSNVSYLVALEYFIPYTFEDSDFLEPSWFNANLSVKPYYRFQAFSQQNNPNSALTLTFSEYQGNVGWYNESYNQGENDFTIEGVVMTTATGSPLSEIDYAQKTVVEVTISGPSDFLPVAEVQFNLIPDIDTIKNKPEINADLISLSNSFCDFTGAPAITNTVRGKDNRQIAITDQDVNVATANTIVVTFTLDPNSDFEAFVESMATEARRFRLSVTVESDAGTANFNNSVSLIARESYLAKAPIEGGPFGGLVLSGFLNHVQESTDTVNTDYVGCTEDDMLFKSVFNLEKGAVWNSLILAVEVFRLSDGVNFALESQTISLENFLVDSNGVIQIFHEQTTQQFLESTDRNKIQLNLTGTDTSTTYEVELLWSMMANWRSWLPQTNALPEFIDSALPNFGKSKDWVRYLQVTGFAVRVKCTLVDDLDTGYFWAGLVNLDNYDASTEVTSTIEYYDESNTLQSALISGQNMRIKAIHTLATGAWNPADLWGWISLRPSQAEPNKRISTAWDWTSISYPLKPLSGETKAKLTFPTAGVAVVECLVDTAMVDVENVTVISRIESPSEPLCTSPINWLFNYVEAHSDTEADYLPVMEGILAAEFLAAGNICCPTCTVVIDGVDTEIYAFGSSADIDALVATFTGDPCCWDSYKRFVDCEVGYDTAVDNFIAGLTGSVPALLELVPSQINSFSMNTFSVIADRINALTTDGTIRYALFYSLLSGGFKFTCVDGVKQFSRL